MTDEHWVIATAILVAVSCASIGVFLVLRKLSMLGDAISHSVLFGIVVAFLLSGSRSAWVMMLGAGAVGLLTAYLTNLLNTHGRLQEDASIGVTFTWLFALGVILISLFAGQVDIDQDCVLFGEIAFTPFDRVELFGVDLAPRAFLILLTVTILNAIFIAVGFRRLKLLAFDPVLATTIGLNVTFWHYALMTLVSFTTVAAFESVGAILVVALLVIPANTGYLLAHSLGGMLTIAITAAVIAAVGGYEAAAYFDVSISGSIVSAAGVLFIGAILFDQVGRYLRRRGAAAEQQPA